ncbi:MAG TPA: hypothetical protein VFH68_10450 [Polyangia bacterium]|nr:hypothetical protein [Polyangia bacterium]
MGGVSLLVALGCGGDSDKAAGTEGGHCYPNDTCNRGLSCLSTFCVLVPGDDGGVDLGGDGGAHPPVDGGAPDDGFKPAEHPRLPQVANYGGPVLESPKVQPIFYPADDGAADVRAFLDELTGTDYWRQTTAEYGVGPLTLLPAITVSSVAPLIIGDDEIRGNLVAQTTGIAPAWGPADPSTIYMVVLPPGTSGTAQGGNCCTDFTGYHSEAPAGAVTIPYAVICACNGTSGADLTPLQERTLTISHELIEAATDPFIVTNPAFRQADRADLVWTMATAGGEVADMCVLNPDANYIPAGANYMVQRSWSNAAARQSRNPCVPARTPAYVNSFPIMGTVAFTTNGFTYYPLGIPIAFGQSKTVDVVLFSSVRVTRPWRVLAISYNETPGTVTPTVDLELNRNVGLNGDQLKLTITPRRQNPMFGGEVFLLLSQYGNPGEADYQTNLSMGLVTN